jgi:hypothetical protein
MKKVILFFASVLISVSAFAGDNYYVEYGFNPEGTGGTIGAYVYAESEVMACNLILKQNSRPDSPVYCLKIERK